jgi:hypothetical protein
VSSSSRLDALFNLAWLLLSPADLDGWPVFVWLPLAVRPAVQAPPGVADCRSTRITSKRFGCIYAGPNCVGARFGVNLTVDALPGDNREAVYTRLSGGDVTKHYYANGQRIATRVNDDLYYVHGNLLGSTVLVTDQAGAQVGKVSYDPWGQVISNTALPAAGCTPPITATFCWPTTSLPATRPAPGAG